MSTPAHRAPPRAAVWLLRRVLPEEYRDLVLADLEEGFLERIAAGDAAELWYWRQALHADVWRLRLEAHSAPTTVWGGDTNMRDLMSFELRQAFRVLRRSPGFVAMVVLTLGVGIGGATTIFSLIDSLLRKPLPEIVDADRLVALEASEGGGAFGVASYVDYGDIAERTRTLSALAAFKPRLVEAGVDGVAEPLGALMVTSSYFEVLGVTPALGRFFTPEVDEGPGAHPQAILTDGLWRRWFAGDPDVIGREVMLNGRMYTIVGVATGGFVGTQLVEVPELFVPMTMQPALMPASGNLLERRGWGGVQLVGRLEAGATHEGADAEVASIGAQLATEYPNTNARRAYRALPMREAALPGGVRGTIVQMSWLLSAIVLGLWLVVCLNVSNLLLARATKRRQELAIRAALGGGRTRLAGSLLLEFAILAGLAGALGMGVVRGLSIGVARLPIPIALDLALGTPTLAITCALVLLSTVACALLPCISMASTHPRDLRAGAGVGGAATKRRSSRILIVAQVAVSVVLLLGTGLFAKSFAKLTSADPGFDPTGLVTARFNPGLQGYAPDALTDYYQRLERGLAALPGVEAITFASGLPALDNFGRDSWFLQRASDPEQGSSLFLNVVSPNFFETLAIPLVAGRAFNAGDTPDQPLVTMVNEVAARLIEARTGAQALGQRISPEGPDGPFLEIVGVVGDSRSGRERQAGPFVYGSHAQVLPLGLAGDRMVAMLKTFGPAEPVSRGLREVSREVDPRVSASEVITMERFLSELLVVDRLIVTVLSVASALAVMLVALGVYGLLTYVVSQRTREFGIRRALGARPRALSGIVVREALGLALVGLILGLAGAVAVFRLVEDHLFDVAITDPGPLVFGVATIVLVTLASAHLPARRAMRSDPMSAIRIE